MIHRYSEQGQIEMMKYLIDLAVKLIKEGYYYENAVCKRNLNLVSYDIGLLVEEMKHTIAEDVFSQTFYSSGLTKSNDDSEKGV